MSKNIVASFSYKEEKHQFVTELNIIAAREGKHKSEIIINLIEEYVKAHSQGNDTFKLDKWSEDSTFQAVPTILSNNEKWLSYLENCTPDERKRILKQSNTIRQFAINIGNFGIRKK